MTEIRFIEAGEIAAYRQGIMFGFGDEPTPDESADERFRAINPVETCIAAFDRGKVVATFGSYDLQVTVPPSRRPEAEGSEPSDKAAMVATAGTTHVTVHPTHRRQGILTRMMKLHLEQAVERGQAMAALWASEERIYGRFGYGPAVHGHTVTIPARTVEAAPPSGDVTVHPLTADEARSVQPELYQRWLGAVAGRLARSENWWETRFFHDPERRRGNSGALRWVVAERHGDVVGYLVFRLESLEDWSEGRTHVIELMAGDDEARRALWHFATNVDLYRNVRWWNAPVDDPLMVEADRFRQVDRRVFDTMWNRPLDIPALLSARGYEAEGTVTFEVVDRFGPAAGIYRLEVVDGKAACSPVQEDADLVLDVADLGRMVLGGGSAVTLARAGLIDGQPAAVTILDNLLFTRRQPHCPEVF